MANKSENKFSVGDKVKCIRENWFTKEHGLLEGKIYTISLANDFGFVGLAELEDEKAEWTQIRFELVEQKEEEMTFKNMKFDVAAIAKQLNVEHEEASRIIQEALFEQGMGWSNGDLFSQYTDKVWLFVRDGKRITWANNDDAYLKSCTIKPTYTIVEAEEQQEIVELNGKKYNKQELEKALSLLKPID